MPADLIWTRQARSDLLDIYVRIGLEQPVAAERWFDRIESKTELLRDRPRIGSRRPDIRSGLRMLVESPFLILYRTIPDTDEGVISAIEIVRIVDGRRDLAQIL
jgi:toxin ParE1/3/4